VNIRGLSLGACAELLAMGRCRLETVRHIFLAVTDHYEPMWQRPPAHVQRERVERWVREYPRMAAGIEDSRGRPPQHSFFVPGDEYDPDHVDGIAGLCRQGFGDVEVHLHHDGDTSESLREKLLSFTETLHQRHGMLAKDDQGRITYGFIHGNWALDNCRPDGRWCGVNDELTILRETGCYADFTLPAAPSPCQTRAMNQIYYAIDDPEHPKSHDRGIRAEVGKTPPADGLLLIQGPLSWDWGRRKWGVVPRLENADLTGHFPPTIERFGNWCRCRVAVRGREDWLFIKLHTHGAQEANADVLLGEPMRRFHQELAVLVAEFPELQYHYVTARQMASLVHQAESGQRAPDWASEQNSVRTAGPAT
jgi:hypothetical protein